MSKITKETSIQKSLLKWYHKHARDLPWRRTKDPYAIWVSEIMLQQTQVHTVIPYYEKWMRRFPTIRKLANADLEEVLKFWAGLGYYRRARMLHKGAQEILRSKQGSLPDSADQLQKLSGIGPYTAGAIASIAFGQPTPVVDGNVIRILTRIYAINSDVVESKTIKFLWELASSLVPKKSPGDFNQAMMELGATVCSPDNPQCLICPVQSVCESYKSSQQTRYPVKKTKEKIQKLKTAALILRNSQNKLCIQKQKENERWGGLWTFPFYEDKETLVRVSKLRSIKNKMPLVTIRHGFTKYQIDLEVFEHKSAGKINEPKTSAVSTTKWVNASDLNQYAFPSPHKKIVRVLQKL